MNKLVRRLERRGGRTGGKRMDKEEKWVGGGGR